MIGKLTGKVDVIESDSIILDVGGVGYLVYVSGYTIAKIQSDAIISMIIETHVREELIHLYGFLTYEEKNCFLKLNSVSGVGTKLALSILSGLQPSEVAASVASNNKLAFKQISGVGLKLAERIILELKDKIFASTIAQNISSTSNNSLMQDAIAALSGLGINKVESYNLVNKIISENHSIQIDEVIRLALKSRSGN